MRGGSVLEDVHGAKQSVSSPDQRRGESSSGQHEGICSATAYLWHRLGDEAGAGKFLYTAIDLPATRVDQVNPGADDLWGVRSSKRVVVSHLVVPHPYISRVGIKLGSRNPTNEPCRDGIEAIGPRLSRMERWL